MCIYIYVPYHTRAIFKNLKAINIRSTIYFIHFPYSISQADIVTYPSVDPSCALAVCHFNVFQSKP